MLVFVSALIYIWYIAMYALNLYTVYSHVCFNFHMVLFFAVFVGWKPSTEVYVHLRKYYTFGSHAKAEHACTRV